MGQMRKIMLVEDNILDADFTQRVLRLNNLDDDLVLAADGLEAMNSLERQAKELSLPDLILLDINLPDISGIDLLTRIKGDSRFKRIPVVILTGSNEDQDIQKSYDLGATSYLVKPISNDALMLVIDILFSPGSQISRHPQVS
jgi:two-component system response regulator